MKTRRRTIESRSILSRNETRGTRSSTSTDEPSPPTSSSTSIPTTTTTATTITPATIQVETTEIPITTTTTTPGPTTAANDADNTTLKSNVWQYFKRCTNVFPLKAKCSLCQEDLLTPNHSTSSLRRHLAQRHSLKEFDSTAPSRSSITIFTLTEEEKRKLDSLAIDAIIKDTRVFNDFQKPGFKKFINALKPGYKPPHRNIIVKRLKRLHHKHTIETKSEFEQADFLSITCDFWKNRQQKSFLVITGHYIDKDFNEHSKVLKFVCFEERHLSSLIAQEIEKHLISLGLFNKLITITCDGASNMRNMFNYFTRRNIKYIHCIAHKLHLIICNSLNLWVTPRTKKHTTNTEETTEGSSDEDVASDDEPETMLNNMIRSMSVDLHDVSNEANTSESEIDDESQENESSQGQSLSVRTYTDSPSDEDDWVDDNDDDEISDNFIEGVNSEEDVMSEVQQKVREVIHISRSIIAIIKKTTLLSTFIEKRRLSMNMTSKKNKKIKRNLSNDVKTRWNSTFKMILSILTYRDIINEMFKSKTTLDLTCKQRRKLTAMELTTDQWDLLEFIINILEPFYSATKVLSNKKYPTIGSALYIIRTLEEYLQKEENNPIVNSLKAQVFIKFRHYMFSDVEQFNTLKLYGYFDPTGFSALNKAEQNTIERELPLIYKKEFELSSSSSPLTSSSSTNQQTTKGNNIDKAWQSFLKITNKDVQQEPMTTTTTIQHEIKVYRNLATKFNFIDRQFTNPIIFWKENSTEIPLLSRMARSYLSAPATSVQSESAFSVSAYYGRKERSRLSPENLAMSVFLKDKL